MLQIRIRITLIRAQIRILNKAGYASKVKSPKQDRIEVKSRIRISIKVMQIRNTCGYSANYKNNPVMVMFMPSLEKCCLVKRELLVISVDAGRPFHNSRREMLTPHDNPATCRVQFEAGKVYDPFKKVG